VLPAAVLVIEQNTSPHSRSTQVEGVLPAVCCELPAVLEVAQGIASQSVVQESPSLTTPGPPPASPASLTVKLSDRLCTVSTQAV
jgi:hypothetical protein